ncbi:hypothetical protein SUGI_0985300 [Cryptomeria japonica]|nr:hypothetical protein SUGI_0985300 [Cryptomeria japonica]
MIPCHSIGKTKFRRPSKVFYQIQIHDQAVLLQFYMVLEYTRAGKKKHKQSFAANFREPRNNCLEQDLLPYVLAPVLKPTDVSSVIMVLGHQGKLSCLGLVIVIGGSVVSMRERSLSICQAQCSKKSVSVQMTIKRKMLPGNIVLWSPMCMPQSSCGQEDYYAHSRHQMYHGFY